jgi:hypothetical protein
MFFASAASAPHRAGRYLSLARCRIGAGAHGALVLL